MWTILGFQLYLNVFPEEQILRTLQKECKTLLRHYSTTTSYTYRAERYHREEEKEQVIEVS